MNDMSQRMGRLVRRRWWGALALALLVFGCGGGVGTGGTGSFAVGPISGFGSIIVNGVRFDDVDARVESDDGSPRGSDSLRLGMMVEVDADEVRNAQAAARQVRVVSELIGRVDSVDPLLGQLVVNGLTVRTNASTVFDEQFAGGLSGIAVASLIEVYGFADGAAGAVLATRLEPRPGATAFKFRGALSALDRVARTFRIGSQSFSYLGLSPEPQGLANGAIVRVVVGTARDGAGRWTVTALTGGVPSRDGVDGEADGLISAYNSDADFRVNGLPVDASGAVVQGGPLAAGLRVEVHGRLQAGVLIASTVKVERDEGAGEFELHGTIDSVDPGSQTLRLRGRSELVSTARPGLKFEGGTAADLLPGRRIELKGVLSADGTRVEATEIEFDS